MSEVAVIKQDEFCELLLTDLVHSDLNMRQSSPTDPEQDAKLRASLKADGVLQSVIVHPVEVGRGRKKTLKYGVVGGKRRFTQLQGLAKDGEINPDKTYVPARIVVDRARALAASIAENMHRQDVHPVDEFVAFKRLIDEGVDQKAIALEFGVTQHYIRQRLALGNVHDEILNAYLSGKIRIDVVEAYTVEPDRAKQLAAFKKLPNYAWKHDIKKALLGAGISSRDRRVQFVTLDAYREAGGALSEDLFDEDTLIQDAELLDRLYAAELSARVAKLEKEGWKWVEHNPEAEWEGTHRYTRLAGNKGKYTKEQKAESGCFYFVSTDGKFKTVRGIQKKPKASSSSSSSKSAAKKKDDNEYSQALTSDLRFARQQAIRIAMNRSPGFAIDLLHFQLVSDAFEDGLTDTIVKVSSSYGYGGYDGVIRNDATENSGSERATDALHRHFESLDMSWRDDHHDDFSRFVAFRSLPDETKESLTAAAISQHIHTMTRGRDAMTDAIVSEHDVDFTEFYTPTAANFFERVSKGVMMKALEDIYGAVPADFNDKMKKGQMAAHLEKLFAEGEPGRIAGWLPHTF